MGGRPFEAWSFSRRTSTQVFGGVVPELASREHVRTLEPVVDRALAEGGASLEELDGIAVTAGPGLIGALLVGVMYGKGLALGLDLPLVGVHHHEGHLFAPTLEVPDLEPPFVALLVSGGHTMLLDVAGWGDYTCSAKPSTTPPARRSTRWAPCSGSATPPGRRWNGWPGPARPAGSRFPGPCCASSTSRDPTDMPSRSAGSRRPCSAPSGPAAISRATAPIWPADSRTPCSMSSRRRRRRATRELGRPAAVLVGGVACNRALAAAVRDRLGTEARVVVASPRLNTDNAAMIAAAGAWRLARGERHGLDLEPFDRRPLPGLKPAPLLPSTRP